MKKYIKAGLIAIASMVLLTVIKQTLIDMSDYMIGGLTMNSYWWYLYVKK